MELFWVLWYIWLNLQPVEYEKNARVGDDKNKGLGCILLCEEKTLNRNECKMIQCCVTNDLKIGNWKLFKWRNLDTIFKHTQETPEV